ncbi:molybdopterin-dependent oxidoreductase [Tropicibacter oceani]|uniref:Molybdopterin-dependent oxidoreductase n=1 Tax=Tropicibacter oceani TaxID=3058420 RepID=A0ABY8QCP5_9RHOB|nr:molybdopterin-dependent oxidoreductase [Tropicibacter oceani]WGW02399.1 molybdopterin-dependent oxidoreductase [Tropicibacter oceani]
MTFVACMAALPAAADGLAAPTGPVLLTVTGEIGVTNAEGVAALDAEMLRAIGESEIVTDTIWTAGTVTFTGVRLSALLRHLEASGTLIGATAINDYRVDIPVSDATEDGPIIAYAMDGAPMSRRDKGPLWVIYPYAASSDYRTEVIYSRSIWQLDRMTIEK